MSSEVDIIASITACTLLCMVIWYYRWLKKEKE